MVSRNTTNTTNQGIDYAITIIEADGSDSYQPPVIDVDSSQQLAAGTRDIYYEFEFDMSNESHAFSLTDTIDVVIAPKQGSPYTFVAEVTHAGSSVVRVESWLQPIDNAIGDILDGADRWVTTSEWHVDEDTDTTAVGDIAATIVVADGALTVQLGDDDDTR